ncbi:hypothetical protein OZX73_03965 [Bifidobacterium sp. ESL0775]|uniref:hypothetical protein n=1 Tax=Bifidobacterium sp. ESL0775 TaxID=2983230 RepID=UPI0023F9CAC5|nr:hypothetical protein [Bifidobacterium sp. ESL0775]WEV70020.1 hypothetical protein OZX73_03965 [Bifidobacterium sp. ESL0775]
MNKRSDKDSMCFTPSDRPRVFHKCTHANGCFLDEEASALMIPMPMAVQNRFKGELRILMSKACMGKLDYSENARGKSPVSPCRSQPDIWELRLNIRDQKYRIYYSEQDGAPDFVALRIHSKKIARTDAETNRLQDNEMRLAQERYTEYKPQRWGHEDRHCRYCITPVSEERK